MTCGYEDKALSDYTASGVETSADNRTDQQSTVFPLWGCSRRYLSAAKTAGNMERTE
jgi:hypothetical protein